MYTHQAQKRFKIVNPHILAILRAKCTQENETYFFEFYWISAFQRTLDDQTRTKTRFCTIF